jgi:hypothetical protein
VSITRPPQYVCIVLDFEYILVIYIYDCVLYDTNNISYSKN